jgi:O-antigen ligase
MIAVTTLAGGMQRDRIIPILSPNEVSLLLTVALILPVYIFTKHRPKKDTRAIVVAFVILVMGTVFIPVAGFLLRGISLDINNAFKLVAPIQYFLLFWVFIFVVNTDIERRRLVQWMLICGSIVAVVGLLQAARVGFVINILNNWFSSTHLNNALETDAGRLTSLIGAWNALGMFMMVCVILAWAVLPVTQGRLNRLIVISSMVLCGLTLIASGSFAGILGMAAGIALVLILTKRTLKMVPVMILGVLGLILLLLVAQSILRPLVEQRIAFQFEGTDTLIPQTLTFRFDVWRDVFFPPIRQYFPQAVYPKVPADYAWLFEESQYIMLLFRTGLAGFLAHFIWVGIIVFWLYRRLRPSVGYMKSLIAGVLTIVLVLSISGVTNAVFSYTGSIDYMWILFALVASSRGVL